MWNIVGPWTSSIEMDLKTDLKTDDDCATGNIFLILMVTVIILMLAFVVIFILSCKLRQRRNDQQGRGFKSIHFFVLDILRRISFLR